MQEAIKQIGWAVDQTDPESFAKISVGLIEMAGGKGNPFEEARLLIIDKGALNQFSLRFLQFPHAGQPGKG